VSVICSDKTGTLTLNQMMVTKLRTATHAFEVAGQGYDPYSGEVKLGESAIRKDNPDLMRQLYWLALPGVLANDGGLNPPNPTAAQWPSKRSLSGAKPIEVGSAVATDPDAINAGTDKEGKQWTIAGDPTDVAVLVLGHKVGVEGNINAFKSRYVQVRRRRRVGGGRGACACAARRVDAGGIRRGERRRASAAATATTRA
jgi:magnesium-transporting ATPase (P-type)